MKNKIHTRLWQLTLAVICIGIFSFAGRQLAYIGNASGNDTANVSGAMRATKAFIVRDTFTTKPGDYLQLWRNSTKLTCFDSAGRLLAPEGIFGTVTRDGTSKILTDGDIRMTAAKGIRIYNPTSLADVNIGNNATSSSTSAGRVVIGAANTYQSANNLAMALLGRLNTVNTTGNFLNIFGSFNTFTAGNNLTNMGNRNTFTAGDFSGAFGNDNVINHTGTVQNIASFVIGNNDTVLHASCFIFGAAQKTTANNQLIFGQNNNGFTDGFLDVYFGTGPVRSAAQADSIRTVTINGSGAADLANKPGGAIRIAAGKSTGNATPPDIRFATATATTSGSTRQTLTDRWWIKGETGQLSNSSSPTSWLDITGANGYSQLRLRTTYTPTGSADANGNTGDVAHDADYIYIKTAAGWKRSALSTF